MRIVALVLLCLLPNVPTVAAEASSVLVVEDPSGDALAGGIAPSPTHEWADLVKAEIEEVSDEAFTLRLFVAGNGPAHADGVVLLNFLVGDQWYFMGYGALVFPGGRYEGGFYCPSDDQGSPTGECPDLLGGSYGNGVFVLPDVPRSLFGLDRPSAVMERPWIESGNHVLATVWLRADRSEEGLPFMFQRGAPVPIAPSEPTAEKTGAAPAASGMDPGARLPAAEAPMPSIVAAFGMIAVSALVPRRRRAKGGSS